MTDRDQIDWVHIPRGTTIIGTNESEVPELLSRHQDLSVSEQWFLKECPRHISLQDSFLISRTTVTRQQWAEYQHTTNAPHSRPATTEDQLPIEVSWDDARNYCEWLSARTARRVRLPTETEWERAARGGDGREYPWGNHFDRALCNTREAGNGQALPVGSLPGGASPFGILDMAGNVDEWTATLYAPYPGAPPTVPDTELWAVDPHITRGGSFRQSRDLARCARRHAIYPPLHGAGIRLVAEI